DAARSSTSTHGGSKHPAGSGSVTLVLLNSLDGLAHYGETVRFDVSTTSTDQPWVGLKCYQDLSPVGESWEGYFPGSLSDGNFDLDSPTWTSGAADCTATLTNPQWEFLASTTFHVYA